MTLPVRRFNMASIKDNSIVVLLGRRGCGKSVIVADLMYHKRDIPVGVVISPTEKANPYFKDYVPGLFIHDEYTPEIVEKVVRRQKMISTRSKKETIMHGGSDIDPRMFFIMDDCLYDNRWKHDKDINYIFLNGRHINMLYILTMQYPLGIQPTLRTNVDFTFILREASMRNRKLIYENYAGIIPTFTMFCEIMDACTEDYECLVLNNSINSNRLEDVLFWYKADVHAKFRMGASEFWRVHDEECGDDDEEEADEMYDPNRLAKCRGGGPCIDVRKLA